jgi:hypothetical protein
LKAGDNALEAANLARIQEIKAIGSANKWRLLPRFGLAILLLVVALNLQNVQIRTALLLAMFCVLAWTAHGVHQPVTVPERVFELLAQFQPLSEASRYGLDDLQMQLRHGSRFGDAFEIDRWCRRELSLSIDVAGVVHRTHRDEFLSRSLESNGELSERAPQTDDCQVLPIVPNQSKSGKLQ